MNMFFKIILVVGVIYGLLFPFIQHQHAPKLIVTKPYTTDDAWLEEKPVATQVAASPIQPEVQDLTVPDFASLPTIEKKKAFFAYLKPVIAAKNRKIQQQRIILNDAQEQLHNGQSLTESQQQTISSLQQQLYVSGDLKKIDAIEQLLSKLDEIPLALVLVQGANESAWGTSRFAQQGYNFFGLWCYRKGCGFVPKRRVSDASHEVAKFNDLKAGIDYYFLMLNRHRAYQALRDIRMGLRVKGQSVTAEALLPGLLKYSQRGQAYVDELSSMLRTNRKYM